MRSFRGRDFPWQLIYRPHNRGLLIFEQILETYAEIRNFGSAKSDEFAHIGHVAWSLTV